MRAAYWTCVSGSKALGELRSYCFKPQFANFSIVLRGIPFGCVPVVQYGHRVLRGHSEFRLTPVRIQRPVSLGRCFTVFSFENLDVRCLRKSCLSRLLGLERFGVGCLSVLQRRVRDREGFAASLALFFKCFTLSQAGVHAARSFVGAACDGIDLLQVFDSANPILQRLLRVFALTACVCKGRLSLPLFVQGRNDAIGRFLAFEFAAGGLDSLSLVLMLSFQPPVFFERLGFFGGAFQFLGTVVVMLKVFISGSGSDGRCFCVLGCSCFRGSQKSDDVTESGPLVVWHCQGVETLFSCGLHDIAAVPHDVVEFLPCVL